MKVNLLFALSLVCVCILSACDGTTVTQPEQESTVTLPNTEFPSIEITSTSTALVLPKQENTSIRQILPNAEFPIDVTSTGKAQLENGIFEEVAAPGSATKTRIWLGEEQVFGDINGDGAEDAAITLIVDPGGSGTFTYLALVMNEAGKANPLPAILLGDRIIVRSMAIQPGSIAVDILTHGADEPMSVEPKVKATMTFKLQGAELVESK